MSCGSTGWPATRNALASFAGWVAAPTGLPPFWLPAGALGLAGSSPANIEAQLYWLIRAREAGCQWCDLEVETVRKLPGQSVREYAVPPRVMLSMHDFRRTPQLARSVHVPRRGDFDVIKIAVQSQTIADSIRLLRFARRSKNCVVAPMGEVGLPARILALREGSALAYAPVAQATAPGQVSLQELKYLYRAHELTRARRCSA